MAFTVSPNTSYAHVKEKILQGVDAVSSLSGDMVSGGRLNARGTLNLLSPASITVNGDLNGMATNDSIVVNHDSTSVEVVVNGVTQVHRLKAGVTNIALNGLGGNDTIQVSSTLTIPVIINGGSGNDTVYGGAGNDLVYGSDGNDTMYGRDGNDQFFGGAGADVFDGGNGFDTADYGDRTSGVVVTVGGGHHKRRQRVRRPGRGAGRRPVHNRASLRDGRQRRHHRRLG